MPVYLLAAKSVRHVPSGKQPWQHHKLGHMCDRNSQGNDRLGVIALVSKQNRRVNRSGNMTNGQQWVTRNNIDWVVFPACMHAQEQGGW
jgi:hypothetical protein